MVGQEGAQDKARVLVIKLGALGDIVLAFPAFAAIRARHPGARITLLTTAAFAPMLARAPWFDLVEIDRRPKLADLRGLLDLRRQLSGFDVVYDLQTSRRSTHYFWLAGRPLWSGIARGSKLHHTNPNRNRLHTRERLQDQLAVAGITDLPPPDLSWLPEPFPFDLPENFIALIPGAAPHRPAKRWPAERFGALATRLGVPAVILGTGSESRLACAIRTACPTAIDLTGRTNLPQLAAILARARFAIGNDTGPMHLAAALGIESLVLFSAESDPGLTAPRYPDGGFPMILRVPDLAALPVGEVAERVRPWQKASHSVPV